MNKEKLEKLAGVPRLSKVIKKIDDLESSITKKLDETVNNSKNRIMESVSTKLEPVAKISDVEKMINNSVGEISNIEESLDSVAKTSEVKEMVDSIDNKEEIENVSSKLKDEIIRNTITITDEIKNNKPDKVDLEKTNSILDFINNGISKLNFPTNIFKDFFLKIYSYLDDIKGLLIKEEPYKEEVIKINNKIVEVVYYYKHKIVREKINRTAGKITRKFYEEII